MRLRVDLGSLRETRWYELVIRFVVGGAATVLAGLIAKQWGPVVGGLFLALPAIFAAGVTLVEKHQHERGEHGRRAASVEAAGAAMGSLGLLAFAICVWQLAERWPAAATLAFATAVWAVVSGGVWFLRKALLALRHDGLDRTKSGSLHQPRA